MTRERFKNVLLTLLILLSVFFSWTLWTFQPNFSFIDQSPYLQETAIQEKLDPEIIVQPTRMLLHTDDQHYGTTDPNLIAGAVHDVKKWEISKIEDISARITDINHFLEAPSRVELIFNNTLPVSYYENFLNIGDKKPTKNVEFDRIVIGVEGSYQGLYFVSTNNRKVLEAKVVDKEVLATFEKEYTENTDMYTSYKAVKLNKGKNLYLPAEKTTIKKYKYYVKLLSAEGFKNALFDDPSVIKREVIEQGTEYQDGSRLLRIMNQTMMLTYNNPSQSNSVYTSDDALQKSIEFINSHAGWDRRYRYASELENHEVKFQLYMEGLPVFNDSGLSEIVVDWGQDGVKKYKRPYFAFDWQLPDSEAGELQLRSGQDAYEYLSDQKPGIADKVDDMRIGYGLKLDSEQKDIIVIEPAWYYLADGYWKRIQFGEQGGNIDGLE